MIFEDREDAGRALGRRLVGVGLEKPVVIGIPRGGVIVAAAAARELGGELDVIVPAKVRAPDQPELGLGAVAQDGTLYLDEKTIRILGVSQAYLDMEIERRMVEIERRTRLYRGHRDPPNVAGRAAVLVDDGIATGGTVICSARALRRLGPSEVIIAAPVAPKAVIARLEAEADMAICLHTPEPFVAVGQWYRDFAQVTDEEVARALEEAAG